MSSILIFFSKSFTSKSPAHFIGNVSSESLKPVVKTLKEEVGQLKSSYQEHVNLIKEPLELLQSYPPEVQQAILSVRRVN